MLFYKEGKLARHYFSMGGTEQLEGQGACVQVCMCLDDMLAE